jgi:hypothetical protein
MEAQPDYQAIAHYRRAGLRPRPALLAKIKRLHPTVDLVFEENSGRWILVQMDQVPIHVITVLRGSRGEYVEPNVGNTISVLDRSSPSNFHNRFSVDRWIEDNLTEEVSDPAAEARADANIHEFSERAWRMEHPKLTLRPDPKPLKET